jgi:hypothetical protein
MIAGSRPRRAGVGQSGRGGEVADHYLTAAGVWEFLASQEALLSDLKTLIAAGGPKERLRDEHG